MKGINLIDLAATVKMDSKELRAWMEKKHPGSYTWSSLPSKVVRDVMLGQGFRFPQQVVSFQMLKGGVAKTTSALHFGLRASQYGARVLMIDLDQQANLSFALGVEAHEKPVWVDVVEKRMPLTDVVVSVQEGLDLIPSSLNNSVLDRVLLNSQRNWSTAVKQPLAAIRSLYDLVVIDTAPQLSAINAAVTVASDLVVLPVAPDRFSILGARKHLEDLKQLRAEFGLEFSSKILFTKFDGREAVSRDILQQCIELFEGMLMTNYIRQSSQVKSALGEKRNLFSAASTAKEDFDAVTRELLNWN